MASSTGFATNQIINLEPLGNTRLDTLTKVDLRVGKLFRFDNRTLEATIDFGGDYGVKRLLLRYAPLEKL